MFRQVGHFYSAVYRDDRNGNYDIYGYNLATQTEIPIVLNSGNQEEPDVYGNFIVWQDNRNGDWDIYGLNLTTMTEFAIATGLGDQMYPSISGNAVVWESDGDIYGAEIVPEPSHLTIEVEPNTVGIDTLTPSLGTHEYGVNLTVSINASNFANCPNVYKLDHWEGDVTDPDSANTTIIMDADKTITAVYTIATPICGDECHPNFLLGDHNHDCIVDIVDFAMFASRWLTCTKPECD